MRSNQLPAHEELSSSTHFFLFSFFSAFFAFFPSRSCSFSLHSFFSAFRAALRSAFSFNLFASFSSASLRIHSASAAAFCTGLARFSSATLILSPCISISCLYLLLLGPEIYSSVSFQLFFVFGLFLQAVSRIDRVKQISVEDHV